MKTSKIIILISIFIIFSFSHVFLQTEIIKLGYQTKKNEDKLQELIDNNWVLKYNIYTLESPWSLDKHVLMSNSHLKTIRPVQVLSLNAKSISQQPQINNEASVKNPIILRLKQFFSGRQAEAKTTK